MDMTYYCNIATVCFRSRAKSTEPDIIQISRQSYTATNDHQSGAAVTNIQHPNRFILHTHYTGICLMDPHCLCC